MIDYVLVEKILEHKGFNNSLVTRFNEFELSEDFNNPTNESEFADEFITYINETRINEYARPPKLKKKQRKLNLVKTEVMREITAPDGPMAGFIQKLFTKIDMSARKVASKHGVPVGKLSLDVVKIRRPK